MHRVAGFGALGGVRQRAPGRVCVPCCGIVAGGRDVIFRAIGMEACAEPDQHGKTRCAETGRGGEHWHHAVMLRTQVHPKDARVDILPRALPATKRAMECFHWRL